MRMSQLIAKIEDRVIVAAPKVQHKTQAVIARSALSLGERLVALSVKAAPKAEPQQG